MKTMSFVWDENKEEENLKKHKISFKEAQTVFIDPNARMIFDPEHSEEGGGPQKLDNVISSKSARKERS